MIKDDVSHGCIYYNMFGSLPESFDVAAAAVVIKRNTT